MGEPKHTKNGHKWTTNQHKQILAEWWLIVYRVLRFDQVCVGRMIRVISPDQSQPAINRWCSFHKSAVHLHLIRFKLHLLPACLSITRNHLISDLNQKLLVLLLWLAPPPQRKNATAGSLTRGGGGLSGSWFRSITKALVYLARFMGQVFYPEGGILP